MLGFFRRYQKSFMLIFLTPALLAMGITGAILSVVSNPGDQIAGYIKGEPIVLADFDQRRRMYKTITNPGGDEEDAWRFLVLLSEAEQAGLTVSAEELRQYLRDNTRILRARQAAVKAVKAKGIDFSDGRFNREWQKEFYKIISENLANEDDPDADFDLETYKQAIASEYGLDVRSFEAHMKRQALVQKFLETIRELAVVDPADIKEGYQEKHHLRTVDLVEVPASRYAPKKGAKEGDPGFVSEEQLLAYYRDNELDFDEPRRVDMQYLGLRFEDVAGELEQDQPDDAGLGEFNKHHGVAAVTTRAPFFNEEDKEAIASAWLDWESRIRALDVMDVVADALEKHEASQAKLKVEDRKPLDLSTIRVPGKMGNLLSQGSTGLVVLADLAKADDKDVLKDRSFLEGFAAERWFKFKKADDVSEVLGSLDALFVLRVKEVKLARTPRFEDIKDKVLASYISGTEREQRQNYENFRTTKYRAKESWDIDLAFYEDTHPRLGDHEKAKKAVEQTRNAAERKAREKKDGAWKRGRKFDWYLLGSDTAIKPAMDTVDRMKDMTLEKITEHPKLKGAKDTISTAGLWKLNILEFEGGWALYRVTSRNALKARPFEEVKDEVIKNVNLSRGLLRAEEAADTELLGKLKHQTGDELKATLEELGLESRTTEPFDRETLALKDIPEASRIVGEAFAGKVGGGYEAYVPDPASDRLFLLRVASRSDAPAEGFSGAYPELREEMLSKARTEFGEEHIRAIILDAKGISTEHMSYARAVRDGAGGVSSVKLRQIFLPPDREIINTWLDKATRDRAEEIQGKLKEGSPWTTTVDRFSEHSATSGRAGELPPSSRDELADIFGNAFAEDAWAIEMGKSPRLVKSDVGYHLVQLVKVSGARKTFQHLLIRADAEKRKLPKAVREEAENKSKDTLQKAVAALDAGQSFSKVAEEYGDSEDINGQGREFELDFITPLARAAFAEILEWDADIGADGAEDYVPPVVEVVGPDGKSHWHLFACSRDPDDTAPVTADAPRRDRKVYHVRGATKAQVEVARAEMIEFIRDAIKGDEGGRPTWPDLIKQFEKVAAEHSDAPDAKKGGALGMFRLQESVRSYGNEFLTKVCYQDDGKPVTAGQRIKVFRGETGYHLVEVVEVKTADADDVQRKIEVSELVLSGTGWQ